MCSRDEMADMLADTFQKYSKTADKSRGSLCIFQRDPQMFMCVLQSIMASCNKSTYYTATVYTMKKMTGPLKELPLGVTEAHMENPYPYDAIIYENKARDDVVGIVGNGTASMARFMITADGRSYPMIVYGTKSCLYVSSIPLPEWCMEMHTVTKIRWVTTHKPLLHRPWRILQIKRPAVAPCPMYLHKTTEQEAMYLHEVATEQNKQKKRAAQDQKDHEVQKKQKKDPEKQADQEYEAYLCNDVLTELLKEVAYEPQ
jgi:hypothetical protein